MKVRLIHLHLIVKKCIFNLLVEKNVALYKSTQKIYSVPKSISYITIIQLFHCMQATVVQVLVCLSFLSFYWVIQLTALEASKDESSSTAIAFLLSVVMEQ